MTNTQLLGRLFASPRRFFDDLADSPRFALPMWLILFVTVGTVVWFYGVADIQQLIEQQLASNPRAAQMTDAQREAAGRFMSRGILTTSSAVAVVVVLFVFRLLEALYYRVVGRMTGHARTYRQWFAFAWWTAIPGLIGAIPTIIVLAFSPASQLDAGALQPLSLNSLFFHLKPGQTGYQATTNVSIVMLLSIALTILGIRCWSRRSWLYSCVVTLAPAVVLAAGLFLIVQGAR
jgi:Yip1-like protein